MLVQVGNKLGEYLVTFIGESDYVELARDSSDDWTQTELVRQSNVQYLSFQIDEYKAGDIIRIEEQKVRLEKAGNIRFIVTRRRVTRVYANTNATSIEDLPAERTWVGSKSGPGTGTESLGEDNRPENGD